MKPFSPPGRTVYDWSGRADLNRGPLAPKAVNEISILLARLAFLYCRSARFLNW
jgi:hypothetical protein